MRNVVPACLAFGLLALLPARGDAQILHYDAQLEGEFCFMCNVDGGGGTVGLTHLDLTNIDLDAASGRLSFDVSPDSPVTPDELEAFVGAMGYRIGWLEAVAMGVPREGDAGWTFELPGGESYALDVPESHRVVEDLGARGEQPRPIRARLYRNGAGEWQMSLQPGPHEGTGLSADTPADGSD